MIVTRMNKIKVVAIITSFATGLLLFLASNLSLALTNKNYCVVLWHSPLTSAVRLPYWTWRATMLLFLVSILATAAMWIVVAVQTWRRKKVHP